MKCYIYKITNNINGKVYLGSTIKTPQERFQQHLSDLKHNRHHNSHLQYAYEKYGEEVFTITAKEYDLESENELRLLEERYINFCWNSNSLYNLSKKGDGGDIVSYHPNNKEIRKKIGIGTKRAYERLSDEEKEAYAEKYRGEKNPNYGNKWNDKQKKHLSDYYKEYYKTHIHPQKGKKLEEIVGEEKAKKIKKELSEQAKKRTGSKNPFYGKHHSEQTKQKIREINKNHPSFTNNKQVIANGKIYDSASACAKELNLSSGTVAYRARNGIYGFAYVGETEHLQREACHRWTVEECEKLAENCKILKEFREKYDAAYNFIRKQQIFKQFKKKYFQELRHRWTKEEILELCEQNSTYTELRKNNPKILSTLNRRKDLKELVNQYYNR